MPCLVCSLQLGTALVYPGPGSIDWGSHLLHTPPFLSGLGPVYVGWIIMPMVALVCVALLLLVFRTPMRQEDSFYQILWVRFCQSLLHAWHGHSILAL